MPLPLAIARLRLHWLIAMMVGASASHLTRAAATKEVEPIYEPFRVEHAALAPDGAHVAFLVRSGRGLELRIFDTSRPGDKATVRMERDGRPGGRILNWISPDRLLAVSSTPTVIVTDASGRNARPVDLTNLFRGSAGDAGDDPNLKRPDARIFQSPGDPAHLLFESNIPVPTIDGEGGIPGRPRIHELHRLNVLTGEVTRLLDYDVEANTPIGSTIVDRQGRPRILFRPRADPAFFGYAVPESGGSIFRNLKFAVGKDGWRPLEDILQEKSTFSFYLAAKTVLTERTIPLGFDSDPNILFFASNLRRDTFGIYAADVRTGQRTELVVEESDVDLVDPNLAWTNPPLIFDRHRGALAGVAIRGLEPATRWLDPEIAGVQTQLEKKFPGRHVQLVEWDQARERFLVLVSSLSDPGRYFVFQRADQTCVEYLRRAPVVPGGGLHTTESFAFETPAGVRVTGYLTLPRVVAKVAPPVVVSLHGGPWERVEGSYDRDAQALATLGFIVVKLNYRGSTGLGIKHREAIRENLDGAPLEDVLASLEWLRRQRRIDTRRVGLIGERYGGYLALRALQLHPNRFQCAVVINGLTTPLDLWSGLEEPASSEPAPVSLSPPPTEGDESEEPPRASFGPPAPRPRSDPIRVLARWFMSRQAGLGSIAVTRHPELLTKPIFLLHDPDSREAPFSGMASLRASLRRQDRNPPYLKLPPEFAQTDSIERARIYRRIGEFLNLTLYDFKVKIGEATEKN